MSLQEVVNKSSSAWQVALATALGAYGGFPEAPEWWKTLAKTNAFQFLTLWVLVFQGGGSADYVWTSIITMIVYVFMEITKTFSVSIKKSSDEL
tara:strand:- start:557 stop:838 length:282 start_codon:yes stop_codon:yes gene_type:complete